MIFDILFRPVYPPCYYRTNTTNIPLTLAHEALLTEKLTEIERTQNEQAELAAEQAKAIAAKVVVPSSSSSSSSSSAESTPRSSIKEPTPPPESPRLETPVEAEVLVAEEKPLRKCFKVALVRFLMFIRYLALSEEKT